MYQKLLKSILLSLTFSIFPVIAAEEAEDSSTRPSGTKAHFEDGSFVGSPIRRGARTYREIIFIYCKGIGAIDPSCFQDDPNLAKVNFTNSSVNLSSLSGGLFGRACPKLTTITFINSGISLKEFVEELAARELLALIIAGSCELVINRADGDAAAGEAEEVEGTAVYSQAEIKTMIRAFAATPAADSGGGSRAAQAIWWLMSKFPGRSTASGEADDGGKEEEEDDDEE